MFKLKMIKNLQLNGLEVKRVKKQINHKLMEKNNGLENEKENYFAIHD